MPLTWVRAHEQNALMRNFSPEYKVHADSLAEIREGFDDAVKSLARGAIRWGRVRIKKVQVLNALLLWFLKQPDALQREIIGETMPLLRKHVESTEPLPIELVPARVGRRRASHPLHQSVIDSTPVSNDGVTDDHGAPKRRR